jgi:hypothetical protein
MFRFRAARNGFIAATLALLSSPGSVRAQTPHLVRVNHKRAPACSSETFPCGSRLREIVHETDALLGRRLSVRRAVLNAVAG